jgi:hypothetical protein
MGIIEERPVTTHNREEHDKKIILPHIPGMFAVNG